MEKEYLTVAEAARKLGLSDRAVRQWIASGKLEAERNGRSWRILASSLGNESASEVDFPITAFMQSEIDHLRSEVKALNRHIESLTNALDHAQQLLALSQKSIQQLTEQNQLLLEDSRRRKASVWKRIFRQA